MLPPGRLTLGYMPNLTGSFPAVKTMGMVAAGFRHRRRSSSRGNHTHPTANEIGREVRQPIVLTLRPAVLDRQVRPST